MTDTNQTQLGDLLSANTADHAAQSLELEKSRQTVADLLIRIADEAEQLRQQTADFLSRVDELHTAIQSKKELEELVTLLRDANQNLVLATFGAQDLQAKAESAIHRQEEFFAMLAHELRNPLAPIVTATDLLGKLTTAHPMLPKLHGIINRQVVHMTHLVNDLLDASRISTGIIPLQKCSLQLAEVIDSAVEISRPFIDKRKQQLNIALPTKEITLNGDLVRLAQALSNILINATKFTQMEGRIDIAVRRLVDRVVISIKDNGVGIAPEIQPRIFDLFTQGPISLDRAQGGLGIGLSLVRTIVQMHGGSVSVKSEGSGLGSEFIVELPLTNNIVIDKACAPLHVAAAVGRRILLIEDNLSANETLNEILTLAGHTVTSAFDGYAGLALAQENNFDVIVCDIGVPGIDGYEIVKQLRFNALKPVPLCIAISGYSQRKNRANDERAGFDHYLVKPIATSNLLGLISPEFTQ